MGVGRGASFCCTDEVLNKCLDNTKWNEFFLFFCVVFAN